MAKGNEQNVRCGGCYTPLDQAPDLPLADRAPCPRCGSLLRHISLTAEDSPKVVDTMTIKLTPANQARDWRQRWIEVQAQLDRLLAPRSGAISGESIQAANHDLQSFFVQAYHLKDSLILDSGVTGISESIVENAITQEPHLAVLADLANLDKHGELDRRPRSGDIPVWRVSGVSGANGWQLALEILHKGKTLDGLGVASEAVRAWESLLRQWGLI
jgi:hypothetical protein